ncbi:glycosyltransferase family 2 protein [Aquibium microcysteis]|uniref:glycosyltransferase family 2 protein n=1 Tax=Aquibium microcysteis TaxID=675281 RepID=UPI00165D0C03|nr:glycosyltransferase [Aquibium microcysteis]
MDETETRSAEEGRLYPTGPRPVPQADISIVVEMENARLISRDEFGETIATLRREIAAWRDGRSGSRTAQVIFVQDGGREEAETLGRMLQDLAPDLAASAQSEIVSLAGGRYYELKNAAVPRARGEIVLFLDADSVPQPGWLAKMLAPFDDPAVSIVNGFTALEHDDFLSRCYALFWIFPLARGDERFAAKRSLNVNNSAFRRSWIAAHPFPENNGFKVSCSILWHEVMRRGVVTRRVDALALHKPPRGLRFLVWRAMVAGRDNDRRFAVLKSPRRARRLGHAFRRFWTSEWRSLCRVFGKGRHVGMPFRERPAAFLVASAFHGLAFLGQTAMAAGLVADRVERVPDHVTRS